MLVIGVQLLALHSLKGVADFVLREPDLFRAKTRGE